MNILLVHNRYQQPGGEDVVAAAEAELLRQRGHSVALLEVDNRVIRGWAAKLGTAVTTPYNPFRRAWMAEQVRRWGSEIVHVHNFFPRLSPAVLDGAADAGAAAIHTMHNYRSICANGMMLRDAQPCEQCLAGAKWEAIHHHCYRNSRAGTAAVVAMQQLAKWRNAWNRPGRRLIALSRFARSKLVAGGIPPQRIVVKSNFIDLPDIIVDPHARRGVLYVGRLSPEKGVRVLSDAAHRLPHIDFTAIGTGPEEPMLRAHAPPNLRLLGHKSRDETRQEIARAKLLVLPSLGYEGLPMTLLEAFAAGTPVVASQIGSLAETVLDRINGRTFTPGDPMDLAAVIEELHSSEAQRQALGARARATAQTQFSPQASGARLEAIYRDALAELGRD
jgi:glycosyltransferase involved in cell wall biosynthesis